MPARAPQAGTAAAVVAAIVFDADEDAARVQRTEPSVLRFRNTAIIVRAPGARAHSPLSVFGCQRFVFPGMIKDMSRFLADHLTDALLAFRRSRHHRVDRAILIVTVDEHGWPHPAMLSSLELVARDARNVGSRPTMPAGPRAISERTADSRSCWRTRTVCSTSKAMCCWLERSWRPIRILRSSTCASIACWRMCRPTMNRRTWSVVFACNVANGIVIARRLSCGSW